MNKINNNGDYVSREVCEAAIKNIMREKALLKMHLVVCTLIAMIRGMIM